MASRFADANSIRRALNDADSQSDQLFSIAKGIAQLINRDNGRTARELVIRALDKQKIFETMPGVLDALARQVGLFPYADPESLCQRDQLAYEYHRPVRLKDR